MTSGGTTASSLPTSPLGPLLSHRRACPGDPPHPGARTPGCPVKPGHDKGGTTASSLPTSSLGPPLVIAGLDPAIHLATAPHPWRPGWRPGHYNREIAYLGI